MLIPHISGLIFFFVAAGLHAAPLNMPGGFNSEVQRRWLIFNEW